MKNNYLLVHGSFGSPFSNWIPYLRKEIEKLVENEDFVSYEEFIYELREEKEEVKKYLDWRVSGGKMNTETLPDGYVEACKKILGGIENE